MEMLFNELKQYDLELIDSTKFERGNYYVEYSDESIKYFYYYHEDFIETLGSNTKYYKINYPNFNPDIIIDAFVNFYQNIDSIRVEMNLNLNLDDIIIITSDIFHYSLIGILHLSSQQIKVYTFDTNINLLELKEKFHKSKKIIVNFIK